MEGRKHFTNCVIPSSVRQVQTVPLICSKRTMEALNNFWGTNVSTYIKFCGPGNSVGIATGHGLDGAGIESRRGRNFPHLSRPALGPTQPPVQYEPGLSWGKERPGRDADPSPLPVPWSRKGRAISLLPLWAVRGVQGCTLPLPYIEFWHFDVTIFFFQN